MQFLSKEIKKQLAQLKKSKNFTKKEISHKKQNAFI